MAEFLPRTSVLPEPQQRLWPELAQIPRNFVLYGGTALALRLGHRVSLDFDFFSSSPFLPDQLLASLPMLRSAKVLQNVSQTLTVAVDRNGRVQLSFFGGLTLGRVGEPDVTRDGTLLVASLLDLAGTKAATVTQRAEAKDYLDLIALMQNGVTLGEAMAAARAIYGGQYNELLTLKSLTYFGDGDLHRLDAEQKRLLTGKVAEQSSRELPRMSRVSDQLAPF